MGRGAAWATRGAGTGGGGTRRGAVGRTGIAGVAGTLGWAAAGRAGADQRRAGGGTPGRACATARAEPGCNGGGGIGGRGLMRRL